MTSNADILAGLVAAAEKHVEKLEKSQREIRRETHSAGADALADLFGVSPEAPPAPVPGADNAQAERDQIRAELADIAGHVEALKPTRSGDDSNDDEDGTDASLTGAQTTAVDEAAGTPTAPQSAPPASSEPATDAAMRSMLDGA